MILTFKLNQKWDLHSTLIKYKVNFKQSLAKKKLKFTFHSD